MDVDIQTVNSDEVIAIKSLFIGYFEDYKPTEIDWGKMCCHKANGSPQFTVTCLSKQATYSFGDGGCFGANYICLFYEKSYVHRPLA